MNRSGISMSAGSAAGVAAVYLLPPHWLGPLGAGVGIFAIILVIVIRATTKEEPRESALESAALLFLNIPEQPLAKVTQGWPLTTFLASTAFLVALGMTIMVRAAG
jgi:hypothetical protein